MQQPGKGVKVVPLKSPIPEEGFQTLLVMRALERLGYDVQPMQEIDYAAVHLAIANGDATFTAVHWVPLHENFYQSAGGNTKLYRRGVYVDNAVMGYAIDKKTADAHGISNLAQLKDPALAKLFDTDGDGKADMAGCIPLHKERYTFAIRVMLPLWPAQSSHRMWSGGRVSRHRCGAQCRRVCSAPDTSRCFGR